MKNQKSKLPAQKTQSLYRFKNAALKKGDDTDTTSITASLTSTHNF